LQKRFNFLIDLNKCLIDWLIELPCDIYINIQLKLDSININCCLYLFFFCQSPFCYCGSHLDIRFPISNILEMYLFILLLYLAGFLNLLLSKLSIVFSISWVNVFCCWFWLPLMSFMVGSMSCLIILSIVRLYPWHLHVYVCL
jgi:hypothetical protein